MTVGDVSGSLLTERAAEATVELHPRNQVYIHDFRGLVGWDSFLSKSCCRIVDESDLEVLFDEFVKDEFLQQHSVDIQLSRGPFLGREWILSLENQFILKSEGKFVRGNVLLVVVHYS